MSYAAEPSYQPTMVWPQYTQATAATHTIQPQPQLLLQPQAMQAPPPLAPLQLLGPEYLASATLHQVISMKLFMRQSKSNQCIIF